MGRGMVVDTSAAPSVRPAQNLSALTRLMRIYCPDVAAHCERLAGWGTMLAGVCGLNGEAVADVALGACLHDVGKVGMPRSILGKPGPLDADEWDVMRRHPTVGETTLRTGGSSVLAGEVVRHHHERFDGRGYPDGLRGDEIPIGARIVAVVDAFDSMRSHRPYRAALSLDDALDALRAGRGGHFDPNVVDVFLDLLHREIAGCEAEFSGIVEAVRRAAAATKGAAG